MRTTRRAPAQASAAEAGGAGGGITLPRPGFILECNNPQAFGSIEWDSIYGVNYAGPDLDIADIPADTGLDWNAADVGHRRLLAALEVGIWAVTVEVTLAIDSAAQATFRIGSGSGMPNTHIVAGATTRQFALHTLVVALAPDQDFTTASADQKVAPNANPGSIISYALMEVLRLA